MSKTATPQRPRILIVEDDYFIAEDLRRSFQKSGAEVIGPVPTAEEAVELLSKTLDLDGAVLDINLDTDGPVFPIADALAARNVPFVFATGYDGDIIPDRFAGVRRFEKPCDPVMIFGYLEEHARSMR